MFLDGGHRLVKRLAYAFLALLQAGPARVLRIDAVLFLHHALGALAAHALGRHPRLNPLHKHIVQALEHK